MKKHKDGYIKGELVKKSFVRRHARKLIAFEIALAVGYFAAPTVRSEIAAYRLLQIQTAESMQLLEVIAMNLGIDEIRNVRA
jgi:hypothetical protein